MLTSVVSTIAVNAVSSTTTAAGAISMTTPLGLSQYGVLAVIGLIAFLSAKEILSACDKWNNNINCLLDMSIFPLLISFAAIVIYKVAEII
ncbi:MAG: hypothetical protein A4E24_01476 [Methanomethylovorans sp. PtaU1.Bin093]|uniref:hypothetical protein n=1 Tax=Methanomethylovorans sp. PtaU1.Bin093 TaxID=1811679 RepID=UPI0009D06693|nr:hypothetical protein [Methanomethylovorans sp. PtaU1.Bin093]OPY19886.1 MAG: hypothetical protein A4E24_01476 [Methanomethylovorans sp. PtaU1.Bin093]